MLAIKKKTNNKSVYIEKFLEFNINGIREGEEKFNAYKKDGIIQADSLSDNHWRMTNEITTKEFNFNIHQPLFKNEQNARFLGNYQDFLNAIKVYFVFELETNTIVSLHYRFNAFKKVLVNTRFFNDNCTAEDIIKGRNRLNPFNLQVLQTCIDILKFYPLPDTDRLIEECELVYEEIREEITILQKNKGENQRGLAEFQSFFYFDKLLNLFWNYQAQPNDKILYYPIYLWWKITNILPLRPIEFVITPFNCIENRNGDYFLSIRRSNLKGQNKDVTHKIDIDYSIHEYMITRELAENVIEYQNIVKKYGSSNFLFSLKAYAASAGLENYFTLDRFGTKHLRVLLERFYFDIIHKNFGIKLYYKPNSSLKEDKEVFKESNKFLTSNEIIMIHLGDTRHFSMVNLVLNDFNPILIKDFAGHEDINTSYHYFNHIGKIVKCMSYYKFQELKKGIIETSLNPVSHEGINMKSIALGLEIQRRKHYKEVDYGQCYSDKFLVGDISHCIPVEGDCLFCDYLKKDFKNHNIDLDKRKNEIEKRLDEEGLYLVRILKSYNETYKDYEDFQRRILNIQQGATEYLKLSKEVNMGEVHE